jgi:hypothetical protein
LLYNSTLRILKLYLLNPMLNSDADLLEYIL